MKTMRVLLCAVVALSFSCLVATATAWAATDANLTAGTNADTTAEEKPAATVPFVKQTNNMKVKSAKGMAVDNGSYIIVSSGDSQLLLTAPNKKNNAKPVLKKENGTKAQSWKFKYNFKTKAYTIVNKYSGKALTTNGKKVYQKKLAKTGSKTYTKQSWTVKATATGYQITSKYKKTVSLNVAAKANATATAKKSSKAEAQRFWLCRTTKWKPKYVVKNGTYTLGAADAPNILLQVKGARTKNKQPLNVSTKVNKDYNQIFDIDLVKAGYYRITSVHTGRVMTVSGSKIIQKTYTTGAKQKYQLWVAKLNADGTVTFYNKATGRALAIAGNKAVANKNAQATKYNAKAVAQTQKWVLSPTTSGFTAVQKRGIQKASQKSSSTDYSISVDLTAHELMIFQREGKNKKWELFKQWRVSSGMNKATIEYVGTKSQFRVENDPSKGYVAKYWSRMGGRQYFHSFVRYSTWTDRRLGMNVSSGCVRMSEEHAKYIYYQIPSGTRVQRYY